MLVLEISQFDFLLDDEAKKWKRTFKFVLYLGIIYLNTTAKACRCLRRDRIFGADRDGACSISPSTSEVTKLLIVKLLLVILSHPASFNFKAKMQYTIVTT